MNPRQSEADVLDNLENHIGVMVEDEIAKREQSLAVLASDSVVNDLLKTPAIGRTLSRIPLAGFSSDQLNAIVKEYLHSQFYLAQSVTLERDLLKVSQAIRQNAGVQTAVDLLEDIVKPEFDPSLFLLAHNSNKSIAPEIQTLIRRIRSFYLCAEVKKKYYQTDEAKNEGPYRKLMESLMWINGQRLVCITGLKNVLNKSIPTVAVAASDKQYQANGYHAARAYLQTVIGLFIDEELTRIHSQLATANVDQVMTHLKSRPEFQSFLRALNEPARAGLDRVLPQASLEELHAIIDSFVHTSVHLAQSVMYERSVVRISQYLRQHYSIEAAVKLLTDIEKPSFDLNTFFQDQPRDDIRRLINNIHQFYLYASIKEQDGFFDPAEEQAQKLFESRMWIGLQRRCCIEGMQLIESRKVYQGAQIALANLDKPVEVEAVVKAAAANTPKMDAKSADIPCASISAAYIPRDTSMVDANSGWNADDIAEALMRSLEDAPKPQPQPQPAQPRVLSQQEQRQLQEAFFAAARSGNTQALVEIGTSGINVNARDGNDQTALMIAASEGKLEAVSCLVELLQADLSAASSNGYKAIHWSAMRKQKPVMAYLIGKDANPLEPTRYHGNAHALAGLNEELVNLAAQGNDREVSALITELNVPVEATNQEGHTALMAAARAGQMSTVQLLHETFQAPINTATSSGYQAIHFAANSKKEDVMAYLVSKGANPLDSTRYHGNAHALAGLNDKLTAYAAQGDEANVSRLLTRLKVPVDIRDSEGKTALMAAAGAGRIDMVRFLLRAGAAIKADTSSGYQAIHYAANAKSEEVMAELIRAGANPFDSTRYHGNAHQLAGLNDKFVNYASQGDEANVLRLLNELKVPIDIRNSDDKTALMAAAGSGRLEMVKLLQGQNADIRAQSSNGYQAVHYAAYARQEIVMAHLIAAGANPFDQTRYHGNAHMLAALKDRLTGFAAQNDTVNVNRLINELKVPVDIRDSDNRTALMAAAQAGKLDAVRVLVETHHASLNEELGRQHLHAVNLAFNNGHQAVVEYLLSKGAKPVVALKKEEPRAAPVYLASPVLSPTLFAGAAKPAASASVTLSDGSLVAEVKRMLDLMKARATKMTGKVKEEAELNSFRFINIKLEESGMPLERLYAVGEILQGIICDGNVYGDTSGDNHLTLQALNPVNAVTFGASYEHRYKWAHCGGQGLPAPVSLIPFDALKLAVDKLMNTVFDNWQVNALDPSRYSRSYPDRMLMHDELARITYVEKACKELDKSFSLNINFDNANKCCSVTAEALAKARALLFTPVQPDLKARSGMSRGMGV